MSTRRFLGLEEILHVIKRFRRRVELNVVIEVDAGSVDAGGKVMATSITIAMICVAIWAYLILARGAYWHASVRDAARIPGLSGQWPAVTAVIPARNESDYIARSVTSLLRQDYRGPLTLGGVVGDRGGCTRSGR